MLIRTKACGGDHSLCSNGNYYYTVMAKMTISNNQYGCKCHYIMQKYH